MPTAGAVTSRPLARIGEVGLLEVRVHTTDRNHGIDRRRVRQLIGGLIVAGGGDHDRPLALGVGHRLTHDGDVAIGSEADVDDLRAGFQQQRTGNASTSFMARAMQCWQASPDPEGDREARRVRSRRRLARATARSRRAKPFWR